MRLGCRIISTVVLLGLVCAASATGSQAPVTASPGTATGVRIGDPCPTFIWGEVPAARSYELVVYRLGAEGEELETALRQRFVGSVDSWTPPLDSCLEPGGRYAWSVRAEGEETASEWSAPAFFQVTAGPSRAEFEKALRIVQRYLEVEELAESVRASPAAGGAGPAAAPSRATSEEQRPRPAPAEAASGAPRTPEPTSASLIVDGAIGAGQGWGEFAGSPTEPLADLHVVGDTLFADMLLAPADIGMFGGDAELMLAEYADGSSGIKIRYESVTNNLEIWGVEGSNYAAPVPWLTINRDSGAVEILSQGPVTIFSATDLSLSAQNNLSLSGTTVDIDASVDLNLDALNIRSQASMKNTLKGTMTALEASAINTIKGALVKIN